MQLTAWRMGRVGSGEPLLSAILPSSSVRTTSALACFDPVTRLVTIPAGAYTNCLLGRLRILFNDSKSPRRLPMWVGEGKKVCDRGWSSVTRPHTDGSPFTSCMMTVAKHAKLHDERRTNCRCDGAEYFLLMQINGLATK